MQYGDLPLSKDNLYLYMGSNPANDNFTFIDENSRSSSLKDVVNQGDADLLYFWHKAPEGSDRKTEAQKKFGQTISHRMHLDSNIQLIGNILFGLKKALVVMNTVRSAGKPVVDDWACLNTLANIRPLNITFLKIEIN